MEFFLFIFIVLKTFFNVETFSCGPKGICMCAGKDEMDCSRTQILLRDICEDIGNSTKKNITSLRVEFSGIVAIRNEDLNGCEGLLKLNLRGNSMRTIKENSFENFNSLLMLDLSHNVLEQFYEETGYKIYFPETLETLLINGNIYDSLGNISYSYPEIGHLASLNVLHLDGLPKVNFPKYYNYLHNLRNLSLSGLDGYCDMSVVSNITFENVPYLRNLNISKCKITNVHAGAFQKLRFLERLDLSWNMQLGFRAARNVTYGLQFTNIKFLNVSKVYTTFGLGTQITLRDVCYLWNTSLTEIALSSNRLVLFETNALMLLPMTLYSIYVEDNRFTFAPYVLQFGCLSNVTEIYANRQNTAHDPTLFFNEPDSTIPKTEMAFDDCPYMRDEFLRNISVLNQQCPFFERNESKKSLPQVPKSIKEVHFSDCVLQYNVSAIPIFPLDNNIEFLDFSNNVLSAWTGPVGPFPKLKYVDLSRNYCSYIGPVAFSNLGEVENLQIQQNFIGLVLASTYKQYQIFNWLTNIKVLNLSSNIISFIPPSTFSKLTKLETLDLSVNNIDKWTIDVTNLQKLKNINLRFNSIRSLPKSLRTRLVKNMENRNDSFKIDLRNNSITCSCDEKDFLLWMVKYRKDMVGFNEYLFYDASGTRISPELFVTKVKNLSKSCRSYVIVITLCGICFFLFLAMVIVGLAYKNRWKLRYLVRMTKIRYLGYSTLEDDAESHEYLHDAFISYANEDSDFIHNNLVQNLEQDGLKLCLHGRDFVPGRNIIDNIIGAIRNSRKTIAFISQDYVRSRWCMYEFNMARMDSAYSRAGRNCLVVVMFKEVPVRLMSNEMLEWLRDNTYIEYTSNEDGERLFWHSLCDAVRD
nr:sP-TLR2 [Cyclina sinensis]